MTQQKKWVRNKAGVDKELKLNNGWEITKVEYGYTLSDTELKVFIHGNKIGFPTKNKINAWLTIDQDDIHIASIWIDNAIEIEKINKFIGVE